MNPKTILFYFLFVLPCLLFAQRESVHIQNKNAAPMRTFTYYQSSEFELKNGVVNASLQSANAYLFQINGIAAKKLSCNSRLNQQQFKIVLIDNRMNKTYLSTSKSKGTLLITCRSRGTYELVYEGEVFLDQQKVTIQANLLGKVRKLNDVKTN